MRRLDGCGESLTRGTHGGGCSSSDRGLVLDARRTIVGDPKQNLGGLSGGPLLLPVERNGAWYLKLAGVVRDAVFDIYVEAIPATFIRADGSVADISSSKNW